MEATLKDMTIHESSKAFMHAEISQMLHLYTFADFTESIDRKLLEDVLYHAPYTCFVLGDKLYSDPKRRCDEYKDRTLAEVIFLLAAELEYPNLFCTMVRQFLEHVVLMEDAKASGFEFENLHGMNKSKFLEYWHLALKRLCTRIHTFHSVEKCIDDDSRFYAWH